MTDSLKILIVAGGLTHERDVSLRSGRRVANLMRQNGHTVEVCDLNAQFMPTVAEFEPDVVWPLIHGSVGEDGSVQDLLSLISFPYVGSRAPSCVLASNKPSAKALARLAGVATPKWLSLRQSLFRQVGAPAIIQSIIANDAGLKFPLIVKPSDGGSALGISKVSTEDELRSAMVDAFAYGDTVMVEEFIPGHEIAVSIIDLEDGPIAHPSKSSRTTANTTTTRVTTPDVPNSSCLPAYRMRPPRTSRKSPSRCTTPLECAISHEST